MSNISTFGTFTVARLGIYASHKAIDITGNNISNINTEGYTRQTIDQFSMNMGGADRFQSMMDTRVGSGAFVAGITQGRDQYLDVRYRLEQASVGAMEARVDGLSQIASVLDEVGRGVDGEGVLEARFEEMKQMMQELNTKGAGKDDFDTLFRSSAASMVDTLRSYAAELSKQKEQQSIAMHNDVDSFNSLLVRIRDLNTSIRKTQVYGGNSLEMQDERNLLLDQLSAYMKIDVTTEKEYLGEKLYVDKLVVRTTDQPQRTLVDGIYITQLSISQVNGEDDPYFNMELGPLTNVNGKTLIYKDEPEAAAPSAASGTEGASGTGGASGTEGSEEEELPKTELNLKDILTDALLAKDPPVTLTDTSTVTWNNDRKEYTVTTPAAAAGAEPTTVTVTAAEMQTAALGRLVTTEKNPETGEFFENQYSFTEFGAYSADGKITATLTGKEPTGRIALFDQELYGKLQARREILTKQGVFSTAEELEADPSASSKRGIPFYQKALDVLANTFANMMNDANLEASQNTTPLFSNDGTTDNADDPPITAANISISRSWSNGSLRVQTTDVRNDGLQSTANENLTRMLNLLMGAQQFKPTGSKGEINGDAASDEVFFTGSFQDLFTNHMAGGLANDQNTAETMKRNYDTMSNDLYVDRDAVMGVDLNDEAMNMMMYEKSYAAACRLMTTYDEMLNKLINGTAV